MPIRPGILCVALALSLAAGAVQAQGAEPYGRLDPETLEGIRGRFYAASKTLEATVATIAWMDASLGADRAQWPLIARGYRASLEGLLGKHDPNLLVKVRQVEAAIELWQGLVEAAPGSLELRFLRYAFYVQLPGLFGVGSYLAPDREALIRHFESGGDPRVPRSQALDISVWLIQEGKLSAAERRRLEAATARLP